MAAFPIVRVNIKNGDNLTFSIKNDVAEQSWKIEELLSVTVTEVREEFLFVEEKNDFEQQFIVYPTGLFFGKLVCYFGNEKNILHEYFFELNVY